jgi:L-2,4-diaminobutyric acid acetyltransferase
MGTDEIHTHAPAAVPDTTAVVFRRPTRSDAASLHELVASSPPLDVNSPYAYLLVGLHFGATSVVAERGGAIVGFASAYLKPDDPRVVFVWQVAVERSARGLGLGRSLVREVLARPACADVTALETTITPSNAASWRLFDAIAREHGTRCEARDVFGSMEVGDGNHEEERLVRLTVAAGAQYGGT